MRFWAPEGEKVFMGTPTHFASIDGRLTSVTLTTLTQNRPGWITPRSWLLPALATIIVVGFSVTPSVTQTTLTGEISGIVTDSSGAFVPRAAVTIKNDATGDSEMAHTDAQGQFSFALLKPGAYIVTVKAQGFQASQQRLKVNLGKTNTIAIKLG